VIFLTFGRVGNRVSFPRIKASVTKPAATAGSIKFELFIQSGNRTPLRLCALTETPESAMSEVEFDRLLETVKMAIEPTPQEDSRAHLPEFDEPPVAANDNQHAWPLIPFPEGWYAAC
jgi:hypothetical protein